MDYRISNRKRILNITLVLVFISWIVLEEINNSISRFDYDGFKSNIITPFSFLVFYFIEIFFSSEISINEDRITIKGWNQNVDLRKEDIVGYYTAFGSFSLKTKEKNYWFSYFTLNNYNQLLTYVEGNYQKIPFLNFFKSNIFRSLIYTSLLLLMLSSFFFGTKRNDTLKYKLPLKNIEVHELEVSLREDYKLKEKYNYSNAIPLWEYPKVAFHLNAYLKDEINNIPEDGILLVKEEVLTIQIREKDFVKLSNRQRKDFNPYKRSKRDIVTIYRIEHDGKVLYEKCCLK